MMIIGFGVCVCRYARRSTAFVVCVNVHMTGDSPSIQPNSITYCTMFVLSCFNREPADLTDVESVDFHRNNM